MKYYSLIKVCLSVILTINIPALASQIMGTDPFVDFSNVKSMTQLGIRFKLNLPIQKNDYLKIVFPFPLHSSLTAGLRAYGSLSKPKNLLGFWSVMKNDGEQDAIELPLRIFTETVDSATYFVQFLDKDQAVKQQDTLWTILRFQILDKQALELQKSNSILQVQLISQSSTEKGAIIYEQNTAHTFLYLDSLPPNLISVVLSFDNIATRRNLDTKNIVFLDTKIDYQFQYDLDDFILMIFEMDDPAFIFTDNCTSTKREQVPIIEKLNEQDYFCSINSVKNTMEVKVKISSIKTQNLLRFNTTISNPKNVVPSGKVNVKLQRLNQPKILAIGSSESNLGVDPINLSFHELELAWGIKPTPLLPIIFQIVRADAQPANYVPYNSFRVVFQLNQAIPNGKELKIDIQLKSEATAYILAGSITENLPAAPNQQVTCYELDTDIAAQRRISCFGIGPLAPNTAYHIAFKMSFPYDVFIPSVMTTQFGTVTISTVKYVNKNDNVIFVTRSRDFVNYLSSNFPNSYVYDKDQSSYLSIMKSYSDLVIVARAGDFQDYKTQEVFPTFRNRNFVDKDKGHVDLFVPGSYLKFITYLETFSSTNDQLYLVFVPLQTDQDIIKGIDQYPIVDEAIAKNVDEIPTVNARNWLISPGFNNEIVASSLVSSGALADPSLTTGMGLKATSADQRLIFRTYSASTDVWTPVGGGDTINTNAGLRFLMNPIIIPKGTIAFEDTTATGKVSISISFQINFFGYFPLPTIIIIVNTFTTKYQYLNGASDYNKYTYVQVKTDLSSQLIDAFPGTRATKYWSINSFTLNEFSSSVADGYVLDFYVLGVDKITGALNTEVVNSYTLINGYSIDASLLTSVKVSVSNYWSSQSEGNSGRYVPTLIRIQGTVTGSQASGFQKIALFFDNFQPFYSNSFANEVDCGSTTIGNQLSCRGYFNSLSNQKSANLFSLSRFEIEVTSPSSNFQIVIPVKTQLNKNTANIYVASMKEHTGYTYSDKETTRPNGITLRKSFTFNNAPTGSASSLGSTLPYYLSGLSAASYGLVANACGTQCTPGNLIAAGLSIQATHTDGSSVIIANTGSNLGAGFTFSANSAIYDEQTATASGWGLSGGTDPCILFQYNYYSVSLVHYWKRYGLFCPFTTSTVGASTAVTLSQIKLPSSQGLNIFAYGSYSQNDGDLASLVANSFTTQNTATLTAVSSSSAMAGLSKATINFKFTTPVEIDSYKFVVKIVSAASIPFTTSTITTCTLRYFVLVDEIDRYDVNTLGHLCSVIMPDQYSIVFTITDLKGKYAIGQQLILYMYGIDSTTTGTAISFNVKLQYDNTGSVNDVMAQTKSSITMNYDSSGIGSTLLLSNLVLENLNKNSKSKFYLKFSFANREIWVGEQIVFDLGEYATDNVFNLNNLECKIFESDGKTVSRYWNQVSFNSLSDMKVSAKVHISKISNPEFYLSCTGFQNPSAASPKPIKAYVESQNSLFQMVYSNDLNLPTLLAESPNVYENTIQKELISPGSNCDLTFSLKISQMNLTESSRIIIIFPFYYLSSLSKDFGIIRCYQENLEINCQITQDRQLEITHFQTPIEMTQPITLYIAGVTQPLAFEVDKFFIAYDNDYSNTEYVEYGELFDVQLTEQIANRLISNLEVLRVNIKSNYIREDAVTHVFSILLDSTFPNIVSGQQISISFSPIYDYVFRQGSITPVCRITRFENPEKNFAGRCQMFGLKIRIYVNEDISTGYLYDITIDGIRNPDYYDQRAAQWSLEIGDSENSIFIFKSFPSSSNYKLNPLTRDQNLIYLAYKDVNGNLITEMNLIKGVISNTIYIDQEDNQIETLFARSMQFNSIFDQINVDPFDIKVNLGTLNQKFVLSSPSAIGDYSFILKKQYDGAYYSNLPLMLLRFGNQFIQPISFKQQEFEVYLAAASSATGVELLIDLTSQKPLDNLNLTFSQPLEENQIGIIIEKGRESLILTSKLSVNRLSLKVTGTNLMTVGNTTRIKYGIYGANGASYSLPLVPYIKINIIQNPEGDNNLVIQPGDLIDPINSYKALVQCAHKGVFYYHVSRFITNDEQSCKLNTTIIYNAVFGYPVNRTDAEQEMYNCDDRFGYLYIDLENKEFLLELKLLKAFTGYQLGGYCYGMGTTSTNVTYITFNTQNNGGEVNKVIFDFISPPKSQHLIQLSCFLSMYYKVPPKQQRF